MSRKVLTLEQRLEVVKHLENGKNSREIAQIMAIKMGRTSLLNKVMDMDDELLEMMTVKYITNMFFYCFRIDIFFNYRSKILSYIINYMYSQT
jgi:hypothetical protein